MNEKLDLFLKIIGWSLITFAILVILLKLLGIVHSPSELTLDSLLTIGILIELGRLETKISLLWSEFKKKKKL